MRLFRTILLMAWSCATLTACAPSEQASEKAPRQVDTVTVKAGPWSETVSSTGEISARVQSELSFRISGRIIERLADVGDRVVAGQVLARIDSEEQQADLQVALASQESAEAQLTQAQQAFDRQESLFNSGVSARSNLDEARESLLRAKASLDSATAQTDTARDTLAQTELRADANGILTTRNAEVGQVAQAAQVIFTLAQDGPRDAVFNVDESLLLGLGQDLEQDIDVRPLTGGSPMKATVREISPTIDRSTGTIRVKLSIEGETKINLGSPVVAVARYKPVTAIELPWEAMSSDAGQPAVWVVDPRSKTVSLRRVEVMNYRSGRFTIRSGLVPGEIVVTNGTKFISNGETVALKGANE